MGKVRELVDRMSAQMEHERNLRGKTTAKCTKCKNGYARDGFTDYDGNGSFWVESIPCRACGGLPHSVEVPCEPRVEAAAIQVEIDKLKARMKELKKKARREAK